MTKRILGIDPGLRRTGFGVIESDNGRICYVASGAIDTDAKSPLATRLCTLFEGIESVQSRYAADAAAIEITFVNANPRTSLLLGQARGAAICALRSLPVSEYTALQIKQAVVGYGRANKQQVQHMVARLLQLNGQPGSDAADALACAICHAHSGGAPTRWRQRLMPLNR